MDYASQILKNLMYNPALKFSDLQVKEMTSKHFSYYLNKLLEDGLIIKEGKLYKLTDKGKEIVSRLDEANMQVEKQPKISIAMLVKRINKEGKIELLLSRRLKQPYYGKVGGFTGKLRFGESFEECAKRELFEETGLTGDFHLAHFLRKFAVKENSTNEEIVQDQLMFFFFVTNPQGDLIEKRPENENFWYLYEDLKKRSDLYNTFLDFVDLTLSKSSEFREVKVLAEGY